MKIEFVTRYVEEGTITPDKQNRWVMDIYMFVPFKCLPEYKQAKKLFKDSFPIKIGYIFQKGTSIGNVPSTIHRFAAYIPSFDDALNLGFSNSQYEFDNNLESLKENVIIKLNKLQNIFKKAI